MDQSTYSHTHTFITDDFEIKHHVLTFSGLIEVRKVWVKPDWSREIVYWESDVTITITPDTFYFDSYPSGPGVPYQDWDRLGTTIVVQT